MHTSSPAHALFDDSSRALEALQKNPQELASWLAALATHRTATLWAVLEHLTSLEELPLDHALAAALLDVRLDRLTPELFALWLALVDRLLPVLSETDFERYRVVSSNDPELDTHQRMHQLLLDPERVITTLSWASKPDALHRVLAKITPTLMTHRPHHLDTLSNLLADDPHASLILLELTARSAKTGVLPLSYALTRLTTHLHEHAHMPCTLSALHALSSPWMLLAASDDDELPRHIRSLARHPDPTIMQAALSWLANTNSNQTLELLLKDPRASLTAQSLTFKALAACADASIIGDLIDLTHKAPETLADAMFDALLTLHHRGQFIQASHLEPLLELYRFAPTCSARDWVAITFTQRGGVLEVLRERSAHDPRWHRDVALLEHLQDASSLLCDLLIHAKDPILITKITRIMRLHANPDYEDALLARCHEHPTATLDALSTCGGLLTIKRLEQALGQHTHEPETWIFPHHKKAVTLLWNLEPSHQLATRLEPRALPRTFSNTLTRAEALDDAHLTLLIDTSTHAIAPPTRHLHVTFHTLCAHASPRHWPLVKRLFSHLITLQPNLTSNTHHGRDFTEASTLDEDIRQSVLEMAKRWHVQGALRPSCLALHSDATRASHATLDTLLLDTFHDLPEDHDAPHHKRILLEAIHLPLTPRQLHSLLPARFSSDPHILKMLVPLFAASRDPGLLTWFHQVIDRQDQIEPLRQALLALQNHEATWAAPAIARALEHRNMNIKITAARALADVGTPQVVPRLLFWLGHHDHTGLRTALQRALRAILKQGYNATILAQLTRETLPRRRALLSQALEKEHVKSNTYQHIQERPLSRDPAAWWRDMKRAAPTTRAIHFPELFALNMPTELALHHAHDLLRWCHDEPMAPHRVEALEWVTSLTSHMNRARRHALIHDVRALPTLSQAHTLARRDCLEALGAHLTLEDRLQIIADARHTARPEVHLLALVNTWTPHPPSRSSRALIHDHALQAIAHPETLATLSLTTRHETLSHIAALLPDLDDDRTASALALLLDTPRTPRPKTTFTSPALVESLEQLLDTLFDDEALERAHQTLQKVLALQLSQKMTQLVVRRALELQCKLDTTPDRRLAAWLERAYPTRAELEAWLDACTLEELEAMLSWLPHTTPVWRLATLPSWIGLWNKEPITTLGSHAQLEQAICSLPTMQILPMILPLVEANQSGHADLLQGKLVQGPLTARLLCALKRSGDICRLERIRDMLEPFIIRDEDHTRTLEELIDAVQDLQVKESPTAHDTHIPDLHRIDRALDTLHHASTTALTDLLAALHDLRGHEDEDAAQVVFDLLRRHRSPRIKSTAWRTLRSMKAKRLYIEATRLMLVDPREEVQRSAIKSLGFARDETSIPNLINMLHDSKTSMRAAIVQALEHMPGASIRALRKVLPRTRPDRRDALEHLLEHLDASFEHQRAP